MAIERTTRSTHRTRNTRSDGWDDEAGDGGEGGELGDGGQSSAGVPSAFRPLTRAEVQALRDRDPPLSPWRVIGVQVAVGLGAAVVTALLSGQMVVGWSALYGAATVVIPGALLARGMTSKLSSVSPGVSAVSFMLWEFVKIAVSVGLLILAPKLVQPLSWPALLAGLVLCMKVYWLALLWRGRVRGPKALN
jgi:ATP synthase protein I